MKKEPPAHKHQEPDAGSHMLTPVLDSDQPLHRLKGFADVVLVTEGQIGTVPESHR